MALNTLPSIPDSQGAGGLRGKSEFAAEFRRVRFSGFRHFGVGRLALTLCRDALWRYF